MENVVMQEELSGQMTQEEPLEQVNQAIFNIAVGGQSYRLGSRQLNRADLKTLYDIKNDLMAQTAGGTPGFLDDCSVAVFDRR